MESIEFNLPEDHPLHPRNMLRTNLFPYTQEVVRRVGRQRGVSPELIMSRLRKADVAFARQIAIWIVRKVQKASLTRIGQCFGRDHGTVMHAVKVVDDQMSIDDSVRADVHALMIELERDQ